MQRLGETPLVKEAVQEKIRQQILALRSNVNVRIPSERALSEQFGVSRLSIRAAIKHLAAEGLLVQLQGKGTYITPVPGLNGIHLVCSPDIKQKDPFYNKFLAEIVSETSRRSIKLSVADNHSIAVRGSAAYNSGMSDDSNSTSDRIDIAFDNGATRNQSDTPVIILGLLQNSTLESILSSYRKVIAIQEYPWFADISQISFDDYKIGCDAARIFYEHNHKHLLHLAGPEKYPSAFFRKKGFHDAAERFGMHTVTLTDKMNWAGGYNQGEIFMKELAEKDRPTAVFAANDWMAAGFMKRLQESGLKIPEDVSILGCDNIPLSHEYVPALSTFDLDMKRLVNEIFRLLEEDGPSAAGGIRQALAPAPAAKRVMLPATPVLRESIKKLL